TRSNAYLSKSLRSAHKRPLHISAALRETDSSRATILVQMLVTFVGQDVDSTAVICAVIPSIASAAMLVAGVAGLMLPPRNKSDAEADQHRYPECPERRGVEAVEIQPIVLVAVEDVIEHELSADHRDQQIGRRF